MHGPRRLRYLVGVPGAGKSTLMAALTADMPAAEEQYGHGLWLRWLGAPPRAVELGRRRERFSGTDALGMAVMPVACAWIADATVPLVLAEGDRLASMKFLSAAAAAGRAVELVWLDVPPECARARRHARGSAQDATWLAGRETKVRNLVRLARAAGMTVTGLDATASTDAMVAELASENSLRPLG
jgi:ribose 1,5-bisphosphokinase PhnN